MICYRCGAEAGNNKRCPSCGGHLEVFQRVLRISNAYYNKGLEQASVRNLSGAIVSLNQSLKFNKNNITARNLLGLVYLEMGETVKAISEWVLSQSIQPEGNLAQRYLNEIQKNSGRLNAVNQTIKKYNMALHYCQQDSRDLAVIQLKKVLSMNPKLVKAYQLLALLYLQDGKLEQAKKTLRNAGKIDVNNTLTLRYLREVNSRLKDKGTSKKPKGGEDLISYQSGNETIIMPKRFKESSLGSTLASVVIGLLVGVAVTATLIVPNVRDAANADARKKLITASDQVATGNQTIKELREELAGLQDTLEAETKNNQDVADQIKAYEQLLDAYVAFSGGDMVVAGEKLETIKTSYLSKNAQDIYKGVNDQVQEKYLETLYHDGYRLYSSGKYAEAVENLQKVVDENEDYGDGNAAYYLAQAYRRNGDLTSAKPYYEYVIENYPGSERARTAQNYVNLQE